MNTIKIKRLKVLSNNLISSNIKLLQVEAEDFFNFFAGQFMTFRLGQNLNRSYSIASPPGKKVLDFIIEIVENGKGTSIINNLSIGDYIDSFGPFGFFTVENNIQDVDCIENMLFVATGTGIAPIRSIIYDLLENKNFKKNIYLYFGLRNDIDAYLHDEFYDLESKYQNFNFIPVISRPSQYWKGRVGYCQDHIHKGLLTKNTFVFLCGSNSNVNSIKDHLVNQGLDIQNIFSEKFG